MGAGGALCAVTAPRIPLPGAQMPGQGAGERLRKLELRKGAGAGRGRGISARPLAAPKSACSRVWVTAAFTQMLPGWVPLCCPAALLHAHGGSRLATTRGTLPAAEGGGAWTTPLLFR